MSRVMSPRWFVSRLTSYADAPRTVLQGDDFHNRCIAVFETPELAAAAVAEHNAALDEAAVEPDTVADARSAAGARAEAPSRAEPAPTSAAEKPRRSNLYDNDEEIAAYLIFQFEGPRRYGRKEIKKAMKALGIFHGKTEEMLHERVRRDQRFGPTS